MIIKSGGTHEGRIEALNNKWNSLEKNINISSIWKKQVTGMDQLVPLTRAAFIWKK